MKASPAPLATKTKPGSALAKRLVKVEVSGVENVITLCSHEISNWQDRYSFYGVHQKITIPMLPGTRISICLTGIENQVLVSKKLIVVNSDCGGVDNHLDFLPDQADKPAELEEDL